MLKKKTINFNKIEKKLTSDRVSVIKLLANDIKAGIIRRSQRGKSVSGKAFKKYSSSYKVSKAKEYGSSTPNLTASGKMLNNITWKNIKNGVRMHFQSKEEIAKALGNQKTRKFFGLDKSQKSFIRKKLQKL